MKNNNDTKPENKCTWTMKNNNDCLFETSCNESFFFFEGFIKDNNFKYCPYCGKEIYEIN